MGIQGYEKDDQTAKQATNNSFNDSQKIYRSKMKLKNDITEIEIAESENKIK